MSDIGDYRNHYSPMPLLVQNGSVMPLWFDLLFLALFGIALVVAATWPGLRRFGRFSSSSNWQMMPATVEEVTVQVSYGRSSTTYRTEVVYSYQVSGEYYSGRYKTDSFSEEDANAVASKFPKGSTMQIHVNPAQPGASDMIP
jgi:Protein of unknown function (DUF3592)